MALGMRVGLGPGHIVLDGDPASPPKRGTAPPIFGPYLLWPNGWMQQDTTWYGGRPQPRRHCVRWGSSSPKGAQPPNFRPMSVVTERLDKSNNKSSAVAEMGDRDRNRHGPKRGGGCCSPFAGAGTPSSTMWPGPRSASIPNGVFIHPAIWP